VLIDEFKSDEIQIQIKEICNAELETSYFFWKACAAQEADLYREQLIYPSTIIKS